MTLDQFESRARAIWATIPAHLREGVVGVVVDPEAHYDAEFGETPLMGECMLDPALEHVPDAPVRSLIHLYYGSFVEIAAEDPAFDWEGELDETLRHELRHHLDWLEGHDALGEEDDLQRENMLRLRGEPFDRSFYRYCERLDEGVTALDDELFFDVALARAELRRVFTEALELDWRGLRLRTRPADAAQQGQRTVYLEVEQVDEPTAAPDPIAATVLERDWNHATVVARRKRLFERRNGALSLRFVAVQHGDG